MPRYVFTIKVSNTVKSFVTQIVAPITKDGLIIANLNRLIDKTETKKFATRSDNPLYAKSRAESFCVEQGNLMKLNIGMVISRIVDGIRYSEIRGDQIGLVQDALFVMIAKPRMMFEIVENIEEDEW